MKRVWKMQNGGKIKIKNMATSHIENCIAMLHRRHSKVLTLLYCFVPNGEMAEMDLDNTIMNIEENGWRDLEQEYIDSFEAELIKRRQPKDKSQ